MNVKVLDEANFKSEVVENKDFILVDFGAPWCGPCNRLLPVLETIAATVRVGKVNIDENVTLATEYGIGSVPTLIFFKKGEVVRKLVGLHSKDEIMKEVVRFCPTEVFTADSKK